MINKLILKIKTCIKLIFNPPKYPCKDCHILLLKDGCSQLCDKMIMDDNKLRNHMMKFNDCPDCGSKKWYAGPSGGLSQNYKCAGCGHEFNSCLPLGFERVNC